MMVLCAGLTGQAARGEKQMSENDILLTMDWQVHATHLVAVYAVENRSAHSVMVFDRVYQIRPDGGRNVDPERAYVSVTSDSMLLVDKLVPMLPENREVESPEFPYARLLKPGEKLMGQALVTNPVLTTPAYGQPASGAANDTVKSAVFRLGYAYVTETMIAVPAKGSEDEIWSLRHAWAAKNQRVLQGPVLAIEMAVIKPLSP